MKFHYRHYCYPTYFLWHALMENFPNNEKEQGEKECCYQPRASLILLHKSITHNSMLLLAKGLLDIDSREHRTQ